MSEATRLLFLDDSQQRDCPRDGFDTLTAMGGISISAGAATALQSVIDEHCTKTYGMPIGEPFKASPKRDTWFRSALTIDQQDALRADVLAIAVEHQVSGYVAICDTNASFEGHPCDGLSALTLVLERFNLSLGKSETGIVLVDRPPGGHADEERYLLDCADRVAAGSKFQTFTKLACPIVSMPFRQSRALQVADLVVSTTTAHFAGHPRASRMFGHVKPLLAQFDGRIGGAGVKLWPAGPAIFNLHHWLLGDADVRRFNAGYTLPWREWPYSGGADAR